MKILLSFIIILIFSLLKIYYSHQACFEYSCDECESPEYGKCTKCRSDFTLIDGTCPCYDSSCALCTTGLAGLNICEQCKEGYFLSNNECNCNINNCEQCAIDGCIKCKTGYYYNETSKECIKQKDEEKINCFDPNCDGCFSEEKGACDYCKTGYYLKKGECLQLLNYNNGCPSGYIQSGEYCHQMCSGINCGFYGISQGNIIFLCPENDCLICVNFNIMIFSECDNSEVCSGLDGCLNCLTSDECLICNQGYYLIGGLCKKCSEGCSICSSANNCQVCMSGYELTSNKTCNLTYNFDYDIEEYKEKKQDLIEKYYPEEIPKPTTIPITNKKVQTLISESIPLELSTNNEIDNTTNNKYYQKTETQIIDTTTSEKTDYETNIKVVETTINQKNGETNENSIVSTTEINQESTIYNKLEITSYLNNDKITDIRTISSIDNKFYKKSDIITYETSHITDINKSNGNYLNDNDNMNLQKISPNCRYCLDCFNNKCNICDLRYILKDDKCNLICYDINCLNCELKEGKEICNQCINGYYPEGNTCKMKCEDENCINCLDDEKVCTECQIETKLYQGKCANKYCNNYPNCNYCIEEFGCIECQDGYEVKNKICSIKKNKTIYIISIIFIILMMIAIIFFCVYTNKRKQEINNMRISRFALDQQSDISGNNPQIHNIRNELYLSNSLRISLSKEEIAEEYEDQRRKLDKARMTCMFCKKKPGTYKSDCGCIVCKEHSSLKEMENNGEKYKVCFNCERMVNKVSAIKYYCNICMQNKNSVTHFKCGCALEVCKNCYIKCKMTNDKSPGCRAII